jgi:tetratricopeptide (TPR) repeat protein
MEGMTMRALSWFGLLAMMSAAPADQPRGGEKAVPLYPATGRHHHPIRTASKEAQQYFDQGMTLLYGFNHAEAVRSFQRAAELDPKSPMPHWGVGMALGPNYNREMDPIDDERYKKSYEAVQRALTLSKNAPAHERAYAEALAKRYGPDPKGDHRKLEEAYMKAMRELANQYPDDLDALTLYADSLMVLNPWKLWGNDGKPAETTEEIVRVLEAVMRRDPDHVGANHLYIHAIEASPHPERALASSDRLMRLAPWAGHLVHMPSHIYIHTGHYELAAKSNELGIKADEEFFKQAPDKGIYTMYYAHNIHFLWYARSFQGDYEGAIGAAKKLVEVIGLQVEHMPMLEMFMIVPLQAELRFARWDEILKVPDPGEKRLLTRTFRHYARAVAYSAKGQKDEAVKELAKFLELRKMFPEDAALLMNPLNKVLDVANEILAARLSDSRDEALAHWKKAAELEAALHYGEPPDWYYPVRESYGRALLEAEKAEEAEKVFRADLAVHRRNPRSLFGLREALKAQKKLRAAELVDLELRRQWKGEKELKLDGL